MCSTQGGARGAAAPEATPGRYRFVVYALLHACWVCVYLVRANLSNAILAMESEFAWAREAGNRGLALSAFFVGYLVMQLPASALCARFGAHRTLLGGMLWSVGCAAATPLFAGRLARLYAVRVAMGLGEGVCYPAIAALCARWLPAGERSVAISFVQVGGQVGVLLSFLLTPLMLPRKASSGSELPYEPSGIWRLSFYVYGGLGLAWCAAWAVLGADDPRRCRRCGAAEAAAIARSLPRGSAAAEVALSVRSLRRVVALGGTWALCINWFATNWAGYVLLAWLPDYWADRQVDGRTLAMFTAAPYAGQVIVGLGGGALCDALLARGLLSRGAARRLFGASALLLTAAALALVAYAGGEQAAAEAWVTLAVALPGLQTSGASAQVVEYGGRHSSLVLGLANAVGTIPGIAGVQLTGALRQALGGFAPTLALSAAVSLIGALVYGTLATSDPLPDRLLANELQAEELGDAARCQTSPGGESEDDEARLLIDKHNSAC